MESSLDPSFKSSLPADDPDFDLYTIPSQCNWFAWSNIDETEKLSLKEFFDGSSITRTPRIYKEYRDFIINKFREDPSRRLTFSEVRKSLVGDVSYLRKVFSFLEKWGLINFGLPSLMSEEDKEDERWRAKVEDGVPHGLRVVAVPNSSKPVPLVLPSVGKGDSGGDVAEDGFKLPPLASYFDVYDELLKQDKELLCGNCKEPCDSEQYEYTKDVRFHLCVKCFKNQNYGETKSADDFKLIQLDANHVSQGTVWTEAETLVLLESVLKYGDDWELVAQNVQTKSKLECISKLIQLPFGELMLGPSHRRGKFLDAKNMRSLKQIQSASTMGHDTGEVESERSDPKNESQENGDSEDQSPPLKRVCTASISDGRNSMMKQVALISGMVDPHVTAAAADAAVTLLCYETQCPREIFEEDNISDELGSFLENNEKQRSSAKDSAMEEKPTESETEETPPDGNDLPLSLRMRAATATALGVAAARAKLLADQEDREIEQLVATIIETQLNKLQRKLKHFEDLGVIMEMEYTQMEELEESLVTERFNVLQSLFSSGISRWRDNTSLKSQTGSVP